jgi:uncharacterized protein (DUF2141 family)
MPIEISPHGSITVSGPDAMRFYRLVALKGALHLEMLGMRHSRGSVYAQVKREFGFKGSRAKVYDQLCILINEESAKQTRIHTE